VRLVPLELRLRRQAGPLRPQVEVALAGHGRPLRWAITGVEGPELRVEAVVVTPS
jgi:hypothetical protein